MHGNVCACLCRLTRAAPAPPLTLHLPPTRIPLQLSYQCNNNNKCVRVCVCGFASLGKVISGVQLFLLLQKGQKPVLVASKKQQNKRKIEKNEWRKNAFPSLK